MPEGGTIQAGLTDFHAKYLAYELTKRCSSDSLEKLAPVLADAQVDLNPHQVEAALFAFRSPFSKGAILADEVGLGKTIEAGLLLAQKWAENRRRLLVIVPANLRKQWSQELEDKFHLPSAILETRTFDETVRRGNLNPFQQPAVVLCSYHFARTKEAYVRQTTWDLVVIDEAHRLRNVYKGTSKIATSIKDAIAPFPKILLTATPLQNSLLELYGLVSIIDDYAFGDLASFRVYKLAESNFKPWNADVPHETTALERQLELHIDHIRPGRTADDLLYEILLKSGYPLTTPVETLLLAGKAVHSVSGGALLVCLKRELSLELIRAMAEKKPSRAVCLDEGFAGNDQLKANALQIFKTKGVTSFKTV